MKRLGNRIIERLRVSMFPTEHDKEYKRWITDGGDERFRSDYDLNDESLVIDIGGYKGQFAADIYARYNCRVLVFEPVKTFANALKEKFKKNRKIEVYCLAVGDRRRREIINVCDDESSVYRTAAAKEMIQFEDVAAIFAQQNIRKVELMKINIEGGEYELLPRLIYTGLISRIKDIQIQFHNIGLSPKTEMEVICKELTKTHRPTWQYKFVWENWTLNEEWIKND